MTAVTVCSARAATGRSPTSGWSRHRPATRRRPATPRVVRAGPRRRAPACAAALGLGRDRDRDVSATCRWSREPVVELGRVARCTRTRTRTPGAPASRNAPGRRTRWLHRVLGRWLPARPPLTSRSPARRHRRSRRAHRLGATAAHVALTGSAPPPLTSRSAPRTPVRPCAPRPRRRRARSRS
jgi:hypothetical protein